MNYQKPLNVVGFGNLKNCLYLPKLNVIFSAYLNLMVFNERSSGLIITASNFSISPFSTFLSVRLIMLSILSSSRPLPARREKSAGRLTISS